MTTESAVPGDDPHRLLSGARELALRVRRDQRATWFPLLTLALVTFVAIPVDASSGTTGACRTSGLARACTVAPVASFVYWPVALVLAYAAIAAWYLRTARLRGIGTRVWPYVLVGVGIAVLAAGISLWVNQHPPLSQPFVRLGDPGIAIGLGLLVLARVERGLALLGLAVVYLAVVVVPLNFGWTMAASSPWSIAPHLIIQGGLLVLASAGFAVAQR